MWSKTKLVGVFIGKGLCYLEAHKVEVWTYRRGPPCFHASVMLQKGGSLLLVSKRLGHASIATTGDIYGHLMPGQQKEAANAFAKAMKEG